MKYKNDHLKGAPHFDILGGHFGPLHKPRTHDKIL